MAALTRFAVERLANRRAALDSERQRIVATSNAELARVDAQLTAIDAAITTLRDSRRTEMVDDLLTVFENAGIGLTFKE